MKRRELRDFVIGVLWGVCALLILALCLGCSAAEKLPDPPDIIFVEEGQILLDHDNPGWYRVTEGWLAEQLDYEQRLQRALTACRKEKK